MSFKKDQGYAWVVVFGCFMISFIMAGLARAAGVLYIAIIDTYGVSREAASTPFSLRFSMRNTVGPLVGIMAQKFGIRAVCIFGGSLAFVGSVLSAFAPSVTWITVFWGGVHGVGFGFCNLLHVLILADYFDKYHGLALGLSLTGDCVGTFVFPTILEILLREFGVSGTFLILAGVAFNVVPAAMLLRTPHKSRNPNNNDGYCNDGFIQDNPSNPGVTITCKQVKEYDGGNNEKNGRGKEVITNNSVVSGIHPHNVYQTQISTLDPEVIYFNSTVLKKEEDIKTFVRRKESGSLELSPNNSAIINALNVEGNAVHNGHQQSANTNHSAIANERILHGINKQVIDIPGFIYTDENGASKQYFIKSTPEQNCNVRYIDMPKSYTDEVGFRKTSIPVPVNPSNQSMLRTCLLANIKPMFILMAITLASYYLLFVALITIIIDYAVDVGVLLDLGKYIIISYSVSDLIGRLGFGVILDKKWLKPSHYAALTTCIMGITVLMIPLQNQFWFITLCMTAHGFVQGGHTIMYPILVAEYMNKEEGAMALGCLNLYGGLLGIAVAPMIGFFRDTVGTYDGVFWTIGVSSTLAGCLWLLEPCLLKLQKKMSKT